MTAADPMIAALIREVLAEELARLRGGLPSDGRAGETGVREERVRIADDADLAAFARRVLAMAEDREARDAFGNGRLVFRLEAGAGAAGVGVAGGAGKAGRVGSTGAVGGGGRAEATGGAGRAGSAGTTGSAGRAESTGAMGGDERAGRGGGVRGGEGGAGGRAAGDSRGHGSGEAAAGIGPPAPVAPSRAGAGHTEVVERGLLSERCAERLPRGTVRVRLGRNVRMTPLARDRLRRRGIAIERTE